SDVAIRLDAFPVVVSLRFFTSSEGETGMAKAKSKVRLVKNVRRIDVPRRLVCPGGEATGTFFIEHRELACEGAKAVKCSEESDCVSEQQCTGGIMLSEGGGEIEVTVKCYCYEGK